MAFFHNIPKYIVETFYRMGLTVLYRSIYYNFGANANTIETKIMEKNMIHRFFISYNNMNTYKYICDTNILNWETPINYIVGYICLLSLY